MTARDAAPDGDQAAPPRAAGGALDRRAFLGLLALGTAACFGGEQDPDALPSRTPSVSPTPRATTTADPSPTPTPTPSPTPTGGTPPLLTRWTPSDGEWTPNLKSLATDVVHRLLDHEPDADPAVLASSVLPASGDREALAAIIASLVVPGRWSRVRMVYPQLSGYSDPLLDNARRREPLPEPPGGWPFLESGIMAMVELHQETDDEPLVTTRVLDMRFTQDSETTGWRFTGINDVGGEPVERPAALPEIAARVLDDPRIDMPDSSRWDVHRGVIDERLLEVMATLAERTPYGVLVLESGHPPNVFNTDRISNHTQGRAVDIWRLGGRQVIDDRDDDAVSYSDVEFLYDLEDLVFNIGSPWALDPVGGRSFTDAVHLDHLHVAVGRPRLTAEG